MFHEIAMNKVIMTYSCYNISRFYKNNTIKYSSDSGSIWKRNIFQDGNCSYDDLNGVIKQRLDNNDDDPKKIEISFINSQYKVLIGLSAGYQLDLRGSKFEEFIDFEEKLVEKEEIGSKIPNITNSIDVIYLKTDAISDSLVNGISSNTLAVIPTENLRRSFPFTFHSPINLLFNPVSSNTFKSMIVTPVEQFTTILIGDSMVQNVQGTKIGKAVGHLVVVRSISGATTNAMKDYLKPNLEPNPDEVVLHVGTNDLRTKSPQ